MPVTWFSFTSTYQLRCTYAVPNHFLHSTMGKLPSLACEIDLGYKHRPVLCGHTEGGLGFTKCG